MIPRGVLDIAWRDLASALVGACLPGDRDAAEDEAERVWNDPRHSAGDCRRLSACVNDREARPAPSRI